MMSRVILIRGKAGVGKTTISDALAKHLSIPVLRKDTIYDALADDRSDHQQRNLKSEEVLLDLISVNIKNNVDVIVDNSYHYPDHYQNFEHWVSEQHAQLKSILITCSNEALWKERFEKRRHNPAPNNRITDFEELKNHYGGLHTEAFPGELILDNVREIDDIVADMLLWLNT